MKKNEIKIGKRTIDNNSVFFIVEEGQLNQGDFAKAKQMIDLTAETGADAIEFQFAITEDFYIKNHRGFAIYEKVQFTFVQMIELVKYSISKNLEFIVAPLSHNLIEPLKSAGVSAFNINASDISNPQMLDSVAKSGLPYFISLPLADETEIEWAINRIGKINPNYILLQGQHSMASGEHGVKPMHSSLGYIETLKNKYNGIAGYIDHSPLTWMPSCAVAAGEGGMITTNSEELYNKLILLRTHGITKSPNLLMENHGGWYYEMQELGFNYRLTDFQAALGHSQLKRADDGLKRRKEIAKKYFEAFRSLSFIKGQSGVVEGHAYHLYIVEVDQRKELYEYLKSHNIFAQVHYIPLHLMPYYRKLGWKPGDLPNAENYYQNCLSLPMYPTLSNAEQDYVIDTITNFGK